jgi:hypothetical protein
MYYKYQLLLPLIQFLYAVANGQFADIPFITSLACLTLATVYQLYFHTSQPLFLK